jgi:hypothetical protein
MRDRNDLSDTIIRKFIGVNAEMSVNLPSNLEEDALASQLSSEIPSFEAQQRHIYELMKFDSYPRFIKSEHYRKLVQMNITQKTVSQTDISRTFEKRPDCYQEKKRQKKSAFKILRSAIPKPAKRRDRRLSNEFLLAEKSKFSLTPVVNESKFSLTPGMSEDICYVHFSDGKNIVVRLQSTSTVLELLSDLSKRFQIEMSNVDWLLVGTNQEKPMNMDENCFVLKNKHIRAELRVTFRLDLQHMGRRIAIRAKIHKPIIDVLLPIVQKYTPEIDISTIQVKIGSRPNYIVNMNDPVSTLANERLVLESTDTVFLLKEEIDAQQTVRKAKNKRRDSFGVLKRKKVKTSEMDISNSGHLRYPLLRADTADATKKDILKYTSGQINTQRGLLNKQTLELPSFLRDDRKQRTTSVSLKFYFTKIVISITIGNWRLFVIKYKFYLALSNDTKGYLKEKLKISSFFGQLRPNHQRNLVRITVCVFYLRNEI